MKKIMKEPSTYAGFGLLAMALGQIAGGDGMAMAQASPWAGVLGALVAVFRQEKGGQ